MIVYPRTCIACCRSYLNRSSFCNHRKKCPEYTAARIIDRERHEKAENKLRETLVNTLPEEITASTEPLDIPVPDAVTRAQYISDKATFYVVQTAHSFNCGLNIYKVGRTIDMNSRIKGYPKGSLVILQLLCRDAERFEKHIITLLMQADKVRYRTDFGAEYFEGNLECILDLIMKEYHQQGMSPAHVPPSDIDDEDVLEAVKEAGTIAAAIEIEKEYQKMMLEKKLFAIAKHKRQQRDENLDGPLLSLYTKMNKEADRSAAEPDSAFLDTMEPPSI